MSQGDPKCSPACFLLAAFAVFLGAKPDKLSLGRTLVILVLAIAAALSKEQAAVVGVVFLLTDFFMRQRRYERNICANPRASIFCLGALAAGGTLLIFRMLSGSRSARLSSRRSQSLQYLLTECRAIPIYLGLFVLPVHQERRLGFPCQRTWVTTGQHSGLPA